MACVIYIEREIIKPKKSNQDETYAGDSRPSENVEHSIRIILLLKSGHLSFSFSL